MTAINTQTLPAALRARVESRARFTGNLDIWTVAACSGLPTSILRALYPGLESCAPAPVALETHTPSIAVFRPEGDLF